MASSWLEILPLNGRGSSKLTLSAQRNRGPERRATVTVTAASLSRKLTVVQPANPNMLTVEAEMTNPRIKMYTYIQDDELYDGFDDIGYFKITFSGSNPGSVFEARCCDDVEGQTWITSEAFDVGTQKYYLMVFRMISSGLKYIVLSCTVVPE